MASAVHQDVVSGVLELSLQEAGSSDASAYCGLRHQASPLLRRRAETSHLVYTSTTTTLTVHPTDTTGLKKYHMPSWVIVGVPYVIMHWLLWLQ